MIFLLELRTILDVKPTGSIAQCSHLTLLLDKNEIYHIADRNTLVFRIVGHVFHSNSVKSKYYMSYYPYFIVFLMYYDTICI